MCGRRSGCGPGAGASAGGLAAPAALQEPLTLDRAVQYALDHYPTVRAVVEQVNASAAGIQVARSAYLPRLEHGCGSRIARLPTTSSAAAAAVGAAFDVGARPPVGVFRQRLGQRRRRAAVVGAL